MSRTLSTQKISCGNRWNQQDLSVKTCWFILGVLDEVRCRVLEEFLENNAALFDANYVVLKIDTANMEMGSAVADGLRNGRTGGIPWIVILDGDGNELISSDGPNGNIGCPIQRHEIEHFLTMIQKSSDISTEKLDKLTQALVDHGRPYQQRLRERTDSGDRDTTSSSSEPSALNKLGGKVVARDGNPVPNATVCLGNSGILAKRTFSPHDGNKTTWKGGHGFPAYLNSNKDGDFEFNQLDDGVTDVWAEHPKFGWGWVRDINTNENLVNIILEPQPERITYEGVVIDFRGEPMPAASIYLFADPRRHPVLVAESTTTTQGKFALEVSPPWAHFRFLTLLCHPGEPSASMENAAVLRRTGHPIRCKTSCKDPRTSC